MTFLQRWSKTSKLLIAYRLYRVAILALTGMEPAFNSCPMVDCPRASPNLLTLHPPLNPLASAEHGLGLNQ
jgi:hypothetical protein